MTRRPRNCWHLICTCCGRQRPLSGGKRKPSFVCAECRKAKESA